MYKKPEKINVLIYETMTLLKMSLTEIGRSIIVTAE